MKWFHRLNERRQRYRNVFESEDGKWVLADIVRECGFGQDPFREGRSHGDLGYYVGRQFPALHIRAILDMSDAELAALVKQQEEAERRKDEGIFTDE